MKLDISFASVDEPTAKQIDLVQAICDRLGLEEPDYTFEDYSEFIDYYIDSYYTEERSVYD